MSKLKSAYFQQGKVRYHIPSCNFEMNKRVDRTPKWEIFLETSDVWGLYKATKKDRSFVFHIEFTEREKDIDILETIHGNVQIIDIAVNNNGVFPISYIIRFLAQQLSFSNEITSTREKVQFD